MAVEVVYLGHDNSIDLLLKEDGVAYSLAQTTQINITVGDVKITSTNRDIDPIKWYRSGYQTGEARFFLGDQDIDPGTYRRAWIVVFDYNHQEGIVWGNIRMTVKAEVEA